MAIRSPYPDILPLKLPAEKFACQFRKTFQTMWTLAEGTMVFDTIAIVLQVRNGACLSVALKDFEIKVRKFFEAAHQEQKGSRLRWKSPRRYALCFWNSDAGEHKNCFFHLRSYHWLCRTKLSGFQHGRSKACKEAWRHFLPSTIRWLFKCWNSKIFAKHREVKQ